MRARHFIAAMTLLLLPACEGPFVAPLPYPPPPAPPGSVTITPDSATIITDDTLRLTAVVRDTSGAELPGYAISWSSSDTTIARIQNGLGTVRGQRPGVTRIRAFAGAVEGAVTVFVTPVVFNTVAAGAEHVCASANNRRAYCWGDNGEGAIGTGTTSFVEPVPRLVSLAEAIAGVAAGGGHSCALTIAGGADCWGRFQLGQLGRGPTTGDPLVPGLVTGSILFVSLAGGTDHTCGRATDNRIACWGSNTSGQLGDNSVMNRFDPHLVFGDTPWLALSTGANHTCALAVDHTAQCWGANDAGQIGDSSVAERHGPTPVTGGRQFLSIAAGGAHSCAVSTAGALFCWGRNTHGETGTGLPDSVVVVPTAAATGLTFRAVTAGAQHSCGIATDSTAYCWGENGAGQLGDSSQSARPIPVAVHGGLRFQSLSAGSAFTCGLTGGLVVYCWGDGTRGQLGRPLLGSSTIPVRVAGQ